MNERPPHRPGPPPLPDLSAYRPYEERGGGPVPPVDKRFRAPAGAPQQVRRVPPPRRKRSWLRIMAWTLGGLGVLAAASVALLVGFAPVGLIRDQLIREVKVRTGRDLAIAGRTSLSVFPYLAVTMSEVSLSAPPGMGGAPFVRMRRLEASVPIMPLLGRRVRVERLVLSEPVFELRIDQKGRRSWEFAALAGQPTIMVAQAPPRQQQGPQPLPPELQDFLKNATPGDNQQQPESAPGQRRRSLQDVALGDVRIDNGTVRYRDDRTGLAEEVRSINARLTGKSLASPVEAKGDLVLRGDRIEIDGRISSPKALIEERPVRVALAVASPKANARYDGALSLAKGPQLDGNLKLESGSLRALAAWIGANLPAGHGLGAFALESELKSGPTWVALGNAKARLDEISATGSANLDLVGGRPSLKANLVLGAVDLNAYLPPSERAAATGGGIAPPPAPPTVIRPGQPAGQPGTPPATRPGPQVKEFNRRSGWSEAPIDLAALALLDAEVRLSLASLVYQDIKVGAAQLGLGLKNRAVRTTIDAVRLYGGQGRGVVTLEPSGDKAAVGVNLTLDGVSGLPLLKDAAGFDWIDGKARMQIAVAGSGTHQRAIMESLVGKAEFAFTDGAIVGFNIPGMIRGLSQGRLSGLTRVPSERTDFSEAGASFQIRNGVAETKDLRAMSPLLRLTGAGTVNLGQRQVDATLRPKIVGTLSGQGGAGELTGLELPFKIRGPWEKPQITADMEGLLKNPSQAIDTIRELGKQIQQGKGGNLNQLIEQFRRR